MTWECPNDFATKLQSAPCVFRGCLRRFSPEKRVYSILKIPNQKKMNHENEKPARTSKIIAVCRITSSSTCVSIPNMKRAQFGKRIQVNRIVLPSLNNAIRPVYRYDIASGFNVLVFIKFISNKSNYQFPADDVMNY